MKRSEELHQRAKHLLEGRIHESYRFSDQGTAAILGGLLAIAAEVAALQETVDDRAKILVGAIGMIPRR